MKEPQPIAASLGIRLGEEQTHPYRPMPDPATGELLVDPEVLLKAKGMGLAIDFYYNARSTANGCYGKGRSASINAYVVSHLDNKVLVVRGDTSVGAFTESGGVYAREGKQYVPTSLTYDGTTFRETFADGSNLLYRSQTGAMVDSGYKYELIRAQDASGSGYSVVYGTSGEAGLPKTLQIDGGRLATIAYQADSPTPLMSNITDWASRVWTLTYASRQLTEIQTPLGCATQYAYALAGTTSTMMLNVITDPRGYSTTYMYDDKLRTVSMAAGAGIWTWDYSTRGTSVQTDPAGAVTTYVLNTDMQFDHVDHPEGYTSSFVYDSVRYFRTQEQVPSGTRFSLAYNQYQQVITSDDPLGNRTSMQYDAVQNLTTLTDALGNNTTWAFDNSHRRIRQTDPLGRVNQWSWNADGTLASMTDPRGLATSFEYDSWGNATTQTSADGTIVSQVYDSLNRRIAAIDPLGRITSWAYDLGDNVISMTNAAGEMWRWVFDGCLPIVAIDPLGNRTTTTYNRWAKPATVQDALGFVTTNNYDTMGFPVSTQDPLGNVRSMVYDVAHRKIADVDPLGYRTTYGFDTTSRPNTVKDANGSVTSSVYNARDLIATQNALGLATSFTYDKVGRQTEVMTPMGFVSSNIFDAAGQAIARVDALGYRTTTTFDDDSMPTEVLDALGNRTTNVYATDSTRLVARVDALGYRTTNAYDVAGQNISIRDAKGAYISMTYDLAGRQKSIRNQIGFATTWSFDAKGQAVTQIDAKGQIKTMTFDAVGRNTGARYKDGTILTHQFDPVGQRTTMIDWGGTTTYAFSKRSELIGKTDPGNLSQAYEYDPVGNRTRLTDPDAGVYITAYDKLNRPSTNEKPVGGVYTMQYDPDNRRTTMIAGLGSYRQYAYDPLGRKTSQIELDDSLAQIASMVDTYDAVGNRINRLRNGVPTSWTYDKDYRLTGQRGAGVWATYTMDGVGNLLSKHHQGQDFPLTMTYNLAGQVTESVQGDGEFPNGWTWDKNGNLLSTTAGVPGGNIYDPENRFVGELGGFTGTKRLSTITFDGDGLRRSQKIGNGLTTTFVWDGTDYLQERT